MKKLKSFFQLHGRLSKLFFLLLVFLLLPAVCSFSDVTLTDEEYNLIMTELNNSQTALIESENQIQELEQELKNWEAAYQTLNLGWEMQSAFLKEQKKDQWIKYLEWFLIGFASGNVTGGIGGFTLGVKLEL